MPAAVGLSDPRLNAAYAQRKPASSSPACAGSVSSRAKPDDTS